MKTKFAVFALLGLFGGCGGSATSHDAGPDRSATGGADSGGQAGTPDAGSGGLGGGGGESNGSGGRAGTGGMGGRLGTGGGAAGTNSGGTAGGGGGRTGGAGGGGNGGNAGVTGGAGASLSGGAGGTAGAGGSRVACGNLGLSCTSDQVCIEGTWYPNNVDPNNVMPPTVSWTCQPNPCIPGPLTCECGRSACGMFFSSCAVASTTKLSCSFYATCASPETRIATPSGERRIADLLPGDLVYSADGAALRPVPILRINKTPVQNHHVIELRMADGAVLEISAGHPTADGRYFGDLRAGDMLDRVLILSSRVVPYGYAHTYDILPASDSGTYVAEGRLIGSTLK